MFISNSGSQGYTIANSLRLRSSASAYLSRTLGGSGNTQTWTWSGWVKRGALGTLQTVFGLNSASTNIFTLAFQADNTLRVLGRNASVDVLNITSTAVYRDPSAWMHIVVAIDTTQATAANRARLYVNGAEVTAFSTATYPAQNTNLAWNNSSYTHNIGREDTGSYLDGYQAEIYFVNAQQLTPSSFGQTDTNGVWVPKQYSGTYGTNGFYLKFNDGSSTTNLCLDRSGNGNNWTPTNVSLTAGATYDWMVDTPTNNYAVLNAVQDSGSLTNANLRFAGVAGYSGRKATTALPSSGKWYWEYTITTQNVAAGNWTVVGMCTGSLALTTFAGAVSGAVFYGDRNDQRAIYNETSTVSTSATIDFATNDVLQCAYDADTGKFWFGKNNAWWDSSVGTTGNPSAGTNQTLTAAAKEWFPFVQHNEANNTTDVNLGQRPFTYTPPTGFKALCTANLPAVTIAKPSLHFDIKTRTGTGASANITGYSFSPDLVWIKSRGRAIDNTLYDRLRGTQARLESNTTDAEVTADAGLTAFNSDGYTLNTLDQVNGTTATNSFVDWAWKANGAGVTNTSGSITSTVSANTTAGFSIVTYTGTGANATVGHGLGTVPKMVIVKQRNPGAGTSWGVYHASIGATNYILLNTTAAQVTNTMWNNTAPTSSVFSLGGSGFGVNDSTINAVAYCFAEVPGFSRIGSYTGNGSADGPFVYCGFRPAFVLIKCTTVGTAGYGWVIHDNKRSQAYNVVDGFLYPNASTAEQTAAALDFTANGFKIRCTSATTTDNDTGQTYIFAAFAELPFGGSNLSPANAR